MFFTCIVGLGSISDDKSYLGRTERKVREEKAQEEEVLRDNERN